MATQTPPHTNRGLATPNNRLFGRAPDGAYAVRHMRAAMTQ